jgi:hypothetical protein
MSENLYLGKKSENKGMEDNNWKIQEREHMGYIYKQGVFLQNLVFPLFAPNRFLSEIRKVIR